jgi:transketolase
MTSEKIRELEGRAKTLRRHIVEMVGKDGRTGHLGGSCSAADITAALYFHKMKIDPKNPKAEDRDRFLLSKGHAALVQYAALAELGFFPARELKIAKTLGSMLQGHPDMKKTPGLEANTGSLGMGLSLGLGMALGMRMDGIGRKVYVVVGDGELAEGQLWEAAMAAANFKADNLVAIIDDNKVQAMGPSAERFKIGNFGGKFEAFGWHVIEIDGHDMSRICEALDEADTVKAKPTVIIANTVKGKGIPFAEGKSAFHNAALTPEQYEEAFRELDAAAEAARV